MNFMVSNLRETGLIIIVIGVYQGVKMNFNNTFAKAMKKQLDQGRKAQFSMLIKARKLDLPIDIRTKLFKYIVCPVLLYGSEVWGFQNNVYNFFQENSKIETLHSKLYDLQRRWNIAITSIR